MNNVHGFKAKALTELEPKQYTATNYLKNQLLFLKRLSKELDPNTKAGDVSRCANTQYRNGVG